jgi:hypothetical protein
MRQLYQAPVLWICALSLSCSEAKRQPAPWPELANHVLLGCWSLVTPRVAGMNEQIPSKLELADSTVGSDTRSPRTFAIRLGADHGQDQLLNAGWTPQGTTEGTVSWGTGHEGYSLQLSVVEDSLSGIGNGWTDGGLRTGPLGITGHRHNCQPET